MSAMSIHLDEEAEKADSQGPQHLHASQQAAPPPSPGPDAQASLEHDRLPPRASVPSPNDPPSRDRMYPVQYLPPGWFDNRRRGDNRNRGHRGHADRPGPIMPGGFVAPPPSYRPGDPIGRSFYSGTRRRASSVSAAVGGLYRLSRDRNGISR